MRLLKGFLFAVVGLFIVITLISLLMPSQVMTSRSVTVTGTRGLVMQQISDLHNWNNWHPVFKANKVSVISPSLANWSSGNKTQKIEIIERSDSEVRFWFYPHGSPRVENKVRIHSQDSSSNIQVDWSALVRLRWYPWEKFSGLFVDQITGQGYDAALAGLKEHVESN